MPEYTYMDENGHTTIAAHPMLAEPDVECTICGCPMWKKPKIVAVNWNGLKPSDGDYSTEFQEFLRTKDQRRAEFEKEHEDHERRTALSEDGD